MKTNENLSKKLEILGLDLENIPDKLKYSPNINFGVHKNYNEKNYKVYKFIDVNDIEIFLTPTNRLTDYTEKYAKALPLGAYLDNNTDEGMERNMEFLNIIKNFQPENLEILENQQLQFSKCIPYNVKYDRDYLWQIYYSENSEKYYMLAPIRETECTALLYAIKKQIQNMPKKIYVPICYANYSNKYLNKEEFEEIEKYLCYFTKEWPSIFEVYDKENNVSIQIVGKAIIHNTLKSEYKIELDEQGKAEEFYKLLKILFILETQLAHHYKFDLKLDANGKMYFYFENQELKYGEIIDFIKKEYIKGLEKTIKAKESKIILEKKLKNLKISAVTLDAEYFEKEKQISTFLECKKTFFGKVRYFLKYKKKKINTEGRKNIEKKEEKCNIKYCERTEIKDAYTLEELLDLYTNLEQETNLIKELELDIEAISKRVDMLQIKLKNAIQYIKEIDEHKKSIFEFWKFTNKDDAKQLNTGTTEHSVNKKLKKTFNYDLDFEDVSKQFDKLEREIYTKEETDSIYLTTMILEDINNVAEGNEISEDKLFKLKEQMKENEAEVSFDVFGSIASTKDKIKTLGNVKHRENEKNIFAILSINEKTTVDEYSEKLKKHYQHIEKGMEKFKNTIEMPIYKAGRLKEGLNIFYINPENALKNTESSDTELHKITLKENINCIPLTNIMYYNNTNQTLPLGMNVEDAILINTKKIKLECTSTSPNYIISTTRR